ncbi:DUF2164 domain-containing protein [Ferrimonas aestuarii]|uniref:DUF2164 domain-containing protein n=1 Tax=Ferrimonas aestuarii TaxID=2569539 RepID=A0A4U1BL00_9GAMM|nr:DUF2164 family protein [Ferrimonas aestuarii]TKB53341.1 DUF2164 domain-containing protein [Ferrimonas aestuarii]
MKSTVLEQDEKQALYNDIATYLEDELQLELGQFELEFLVDFMVKKIGPKFYNQGLEDARAAILERLELATEVVYELEQS